MKLAELHQIAKKMEGLEPPTTAQQMNALLQSIGIDPDNLYQELEMTSRYVDTHRDASFSNEHIHLHSHNFFELLYCRNTCGAEYLMGTQRYQLIRGDIIIVPPGVSHRPLLPAQMKEPYKRYALWTSNEFTNAVISLMPHLGQDIFSQKIIRTAGTHWSFLGDIFRAGVEESERQELGWETAVIGNTVTLLTQLSRAIGDHSASVMRAERPDLLERILAYLEEHLAERITLADVAKHFYISQSTISQLFRQKMNVSFYRFVTQRRLIAAKALIQNNEYLEQVGQLVGFADYSTFYRAFRKEYGISPRQFRKMQEAARADTL